MSLSAEVYVALLISDRLVAIMLGRLRMPVEDCLSELSKLTVGILSQRRKHRELFRPRTEYNGRKLQEGLTRIIKQATASSNDCLPLESPEDLCKT